MRRLIRDRKSGQFYAQGTWTPVASQAQDFSDTMEVINCTLQNGLKSVEMVMMFGDKPSDYDVNLPLFDS